MSNNKLRLKKSSLRVLNEGDARQVAGGTGGGTIQFTYDLQDCIHTYVCPSQINCVSQNGCGGGGGGATNHPGCIPDQPVHPE